MRPSRKILRAICVLTLAGGGALLGIGLHVSLTAHLQASAAALASIGAFVVLFSVLGFVGAGREKSAMLMLYFFLNFFLITCLFISSYSAIAFQDSLESWLKIHWKHPVLDYLRTKPCCENYDEAVSYLESKFLILGALGFVCLLLVLAAMYCVIRIVTVPIVMKNLLTVINFIFIVLGTGIFGYGCAVKSKDELTSGQEWIAIMFIVVGTLIFALSVIGIIASRSKSRTMLLIYIVGIGACFVALLVCAGAAFSFSDKLADNYNASQHRDVMACDIGLSGCTNCTDVPSEMVPCLGVTMDNDGIVHSCNATTAKCQQGWTLLNSPEDQGKTTNDIAECGKCPEWSQEDVHAYLKSGLQLLGLSAAVVCFFIIVGCAAAFILRKSLAGYQTDSI
ncbi:hypothetical protein Poli38472_009915 [Pythium oligandrum]|uniref:Tetraspanin n=1 Tax=Pythium oligandrum TaxID=41045 RepID=A0A8K1C801_PYTOL|nr:hypothetical protein Poli38472_009915 [Pythium oligandrum]|eukprot:TMW58356.1 hypothetical protein Poli38472_009915 [Pythium oligandrum]